MVDYFSIYPYQGWFSLVCKNLREILAKDYSMYLVWGHIQFPYGWNSCLYMLKKIVENSMSHIFQFYSVNTYITIYLYLLFVIISSFSLPTPFTHNPWVQCTDHKLYDNVVLVLVQIKLSLTCIQDYYHICIPVVVSCKQFHLDYHLEKHFWRPIRKASNLEKHFYAQFT